MYASISFQGLKNLTANTFDELPSAPLIVTFESVKNDDTGAHYSRGEICLHLKNRALAKALVEAINRAVAEHEAQKTLEAAE